MIIFLIRHAESADNAARLYGGVRDSDLTEFGMLQASVTGDYLQKYSVKSIFSSGLIRAYRTASVIAMKAKLDCDIEISENLVEKNFGLLEGTSFNCVTPEVVDSMENNDSISSRLSQFVKNELAEKIAMLNYDDDIAIVSHGVTLRAMLDIIVSSHVLSTPSILTGHVVRMLDNAAYYKIELDKETGVILSLESNVNEHLSGLRRHKVASRTIYDSRQTRLDSYFKRLG
ncbi:histidine phosphatase superfamily [Dipodascopsis uninucleata]